MKSLTTGDAKQLLEESLFVRMTGMVGVKTSDEIQRELQDLVPGDSKVIAFVQRKDGPPTGYAQICFDSSPMKVHIYTVQGNVS